MNTEDIEHSVAIIGMACRFPGANNLNMFWENLCKGIESITFFSREELIKNNISSNIVDSPSYVKAASILDNVTLFDAGFFGYSPKEAMLLDPQQRFFLEVAWEAFEDACYVPETYKGTIGSFAGAGGIVTSYLVDRLCNNPSLLGNTGSFLHLGNDKDFLSTRVAYELNLTGPSITVQTACSTSLVAIHLACKSILFKECDLALAGASTIRFPHYSGYSAMRGGIFSPDGHCRPFDKEAQGTVFGSGVGAVILKRADRALKDGDNIYATIRGTAVNNDGIKKISYSASSALGQSKAMVEAFASSKIDPSSLYYIECHGTGTQLGDPLEIEALNQAFNLFDSKKSSCAIGSVKGNIGHLEQAAGIASFIKTALILKNGVIPPSINYVTSNPKIDFLKTPFFVNTQLQNWPEKDMPRRAGVNSLGMGGTNAFAIMEEPVKQYNRKSCNKISVNIPLLFNVSAKDEHSLKSILSKYENFIEKSPAISLLDMCYSTSIGREYFSNKVSFVAASTKELKNQINAFLRDSFSKKEIKQNVATPKLALLFSDIESINFRMINDLWCYQKQFVDILKEIDVIFSAYCRLSLMDLLNNQDSLNLNPKLSQQLKFSLEYALGMLWLSWGIKPDAILGFGIGQHVAACVSGALLFEDGLKSIAQKGETQQAQDEGLVYLLSKDGSGQSSVREQFIQLKDSLSLLKQSEYNILIEVGCAKDLIAVLTEYFQSSPDLLHVKTIEKEVDVWQHTLRNLSNLFMCGVRIDWNIFYEIFNANKISLPTYCFQQSHYWLE